MSPKSDWLETAISFVEKYPKDKFKTEDVRLWAYEQGCPEPVNHRAWGGVIKEARNRGMVRHIGYMLVDNPNAHRTPAGYWEKC